MSKKRKITWLAMWMTALGQAGMTLYIPALPAISIALHANPTTIKFTITLFMLGYGASQLIYGPLSDHYGRRPILLIGIAIFCVGCLVNVFAQSLDVFMFARLLQGLGIGSAITLGRSILRDCFTGKELASAASYLSMGFAIGFGGTPIVGAYLTSFFGWQADFVFLGVCGMIFFMVIYQWLPETAPEPSKKHMDSLSQFVHKTIKSYESILHQGKFVRFLLGGLFAYAVVASYNVMTPFLIQNTLGYPTHVYGWLAVLVAIPYYTAASINRNLVLKHGVNFVLISGVGLIILAGISMLIGAWTIGLDLWSILIPFTIATFGQALAYPNSISSALESSAHPSGKTSAMLSSMQMLLIGVLSSVMAILPEANQIPLALVLISLGVLSGLILFGAKRG